MTKKRREEQKKDEAIAIEKIALLEINIPTSPSVIYSLCAFGTDFINWKNYIDDDLEKMKKEIYPKLDSIVKDREGNCYRFDDIRLSTKTISNNVEVPLYIFDLSLIQK